MVTTSSTTPSNPQIIAGEDHTGGAAAADGSQLNPSVGVISLAATGLTPETEYWVHWTQDDDSDNQATPVTSASSFTTTAAPTGGGLTDVDGVISHTTVHAPLWWWVLVALAFFPWGS